MEKHKKCTVPSILIYCIVWKAWKMHMLSHTRHSMMYQQSTSPEKIYSHCCIPVPSRCTSIHGSKYHSRKGIKWYCLPVLKEYHSWEGVGQVLVTSQEKMLSRYRIPVLSRYTNSTIYQKQEDVCTVCMVFLSHRSEYIYLYCCTQMMEDVPTVQYIHCTH